jgi:hypothetical protein
MKSNEVHDENPTFIYTQQCLHMLVNTNTMKKESERTKHCGVLKIPLAYELKAHKAFDWQVQLA